jgi:hypothetical protein
MASPKDNGKSLGSLTYGAPKIGITFTPQSPLPGHMVYLSILCPKCHEMTREAVTLKRPGPAPANEGESNEFKVMMADGRTNGRRWYKKEIRSSAYRV